MLFLWISSCFGAFAIIPTGTATGKTSLERGLPCQRCWSFSPRMGLARHGRQSVFCFVKPRRSCWPLFPVNCRPIPIRVCQTFPTSTKLARMSAPTRITLRHH
ncbi:zinc finger domain-containing protein [Oceaniglobus ichthyenteri]|uniref:zinc finger domain-containing protein n=1 Tax=Oceaniglobus ichthyenteri TaxID=2136177 RepID=UPI003B83477C